MCTIWKKFINKKDLKQDGETDSENEYVYLRYLCVMETRCVIYAKESNKMEKNVENYKM